jgi:hypothetical protein
VSDIVGDTFEETAGRGLSIRTKPIGVTVYIDGMERGETPFNTNTLKAGEYNIRLSKDGYRERRFKISLSSRSRLMISIEMEEAMGQLLINIRRAEASPSGEALPLKPLIFVGGNEITGPVLNLPVGYRTVQVRAFGWEDLSQTVYVREGITETLDFILEPAPFKLSGGTVSRRRFNPQNSGDLGKVEFRFQSSGPGRGILNILNQSGVEVYSLLLGPFETWSQGAIWSGRDQYGDPFPPGLYTARIEAESLPPEGREPERQTLSIETEIDPSINIYPLSLGGGIPGLLFAPVPFTLPRGSFQIEAGLLFGKFSAPEEPASSPGDRAFSGLPFEAGLRFSPLDRLEFSAAMNASPEFSGGMGWGFSGSAKWEILRGTGALQAERAPMGRLSALGLAIGLSYTWAGEGGEPPLGSGRGGGLYLPFSFQLNNISLLFSPGMRWPGPDDPIPRLLLSGGILYRGPWYSAGLSLRPEFDFTNTGSRAGIPFADRVRFLTGGEFKFYPPPSNLVFSVFGGAWIRGGNAGGFGGAAIGILY